MMPDTLGREAAMRTPTVPVNDWDDAVIMHLRLENLRLLETVAFQARQIEVLTLALAEADAQAEALDVLNIRGAGLRRLHPRRRRWWHRAGGAPGSGGGR